MSMILGYTKVLDETIIKNVEVNITSDIDSEGGIEQ
jgi:hypothetical protein